jgi:hypothetical protein
MYFKEWIMYKAFSFIVEILFINILSGCYENRNYDIPSNIDIEQNVTNLKEVSLSEFNAHVRYVQLEANSAFPISDVMYMDFSDRYILLSDSKTCLIYSNEGMFIQQIGRKGRGPGEYLGIDNIFLFKDKIFIHDFYSDDLIGYKSNGTFSERHKSGFNVEINYPLINAYMINDSLLIGNIENRTGQAKFKAIIFNKYGKGLYFYKNYLNFKLSPGVKNAKAPGKAIYYRFKDDIYFKELLNDTLFRLGDDYNLIPSSIFYFGKYKEPLSVRGEDWSKVDFESYIYLTDLFQINDILILECNFNRYSPAKRLTPEEVRMPDGQNHLLWYHRNIGWNIIGIYEKKSGELVFIKPESTDNPLMFSGFFNDIDGGPKFFPQKQVNDSTLVMKIAAQHLKEHIASNDFKNSLPKFPEKKKQLEELAGSISEYDNPVLMFVTFK